MSFQVGSACYATVVDAGVAACAQYSPVSTLIQDGAVVRTVSCSSADATTGALILNISSSPVDGSARTFATVQQNISFPDCQDAAWIDAASVIFAALLGVWALCYGWYKIISLLSWSRGEST